MDLLINYPEFIDDINESFVKLIQEFDLKFEQIYEGRYVLKGKHCVLVFNYDRGDVFCEIRKPIKSFFNLSQKNEYNTIGCGVASVLRYINPNDQLLINDRIYDARLQLIEYSDIVAKMKRIIQGDFTWLDGI